MPGMHHRQDRPGPGIEYSEIIIPEEKDLGTGEFTTAVESVALANPSPLVARLIKAPHFQLSLNINPAVSRIPVLLGRADSNEPTSRVVFELDHARVRPGSNVFTVRFRGWLIQQLFMNGKPLPLDKGPGGYN